MRSRSLVATNTTVTNFVFLVSGELEIAEHMVTAALTFSQTSSFTLAGIRFVELVIDQLTARGVMDASALYEPPFNSLHAGGPDALFDGKENVIEEIFETLEAVHSELNAKAG